jgi:hypothetical protein
MECGAPSYSQLRGEHLTIRTAVVCPRTYQFYAWALELGQPNSVDRFRQVVTFGDRHDGEEVIHVPRLERALGLDLDRVVELPGADWDTLQHCLSRLRRGPVVGRFYSGHVSYT